MSRTGELLYSHYWDVPELGGMKRQSNHWGPMGTTNWLLRGPNGWIVSPTDPFRVFQELDQPAGFIRYQDMSPLK